MSKSKGPLLLCLFFLGLPAHAQTVKVNWRTGAPFASYKTYAWQDSKNPGTPFYGQWVKADVLAELNAKGLSPAGPGQTPDLVVTYHLQGQEVMDATSNTDSDGFGWGPGTWGGGWGWYGGWGGWGPLTEESTTFTSEHPREMLILTISIADGKTKMLVWRGQTTVENVSNSQKGDEKQTKQCVEKLFKSYPPKPSRS
jgi:Domain of unknown function (DUF4136)